MNKPISATKLMQRKLPGSQTDEETEPQVISVGVLKLYLIQQILIMLVFATLDPTHFVVAYRDVGNSYKGTAIIGTVDGISLPVTLSSFTVQYLNNTPTLSWVTQSEVDNLGWNIYRNEEEEFSSSKRITDVMIPGNATTTEPSYYIYNDTSENLIVEQTYWYWLESIDYSGICQVYNMVIQITIPDPSVIPPNIELPIVYDLKNVPNPVNTNSKFRFTLDKASLVSVSIYNIKGELVRTLPSALAPEDETESIYWNGKDNSGKELLPGIYL
ncbi:MAG TPA: hypothetical protein ENG70_02960 [Candidatus Cloacimonetes bacterium]|nr:hypothetical protein [Candidatus Cloacimonadota bacterium]HEX37803.1 hypothetical protein [Candidatus Cloacimonadota bacterium]